MEHRLKSNAEEFRNRFGYNSSEPIDFTSFLQQLNIITVFRNCENFSGLSIKEGDNLFMLINAKYPIGRQNFTICHELYHLYFDPNFKTHKCNVGHFPKKDKNERMADIFASHLLIPEGGISRMIPAEEHGKDRITLGTLLKIEHTYKCSRAALLMQLFKMKYISDDFKEKYSHNIKSGAIKHGYPIDLYEEGQERALLGTYGSLAHKLYDEGKISEGHFNELMMAIGVDINEIQDNNND
ncbi:MAG: ImmA/IrrE family metallo-endopeptidase [Bacteroidales bacterium]|nr:ImmA/IrrE family metallo-endopeptidase [Bacteroidales bacterium]